MVCWFKNTVRIKGVNHTDTWCYFPGEDWCGDCSLKSSGTQATSMLLLQCGASIPTVASQLKMAAADPAIASTSRQQRE